MSGTRGSGRMTVWVAAAAVAMLAVLPVTAQGGENVQPLTISAAQVAGTPGATAFVPVSTVTAGTGPSTFEFLVMVSPLLTLDESATALATNLTGKDLGISAQPELGRYRLIVYGGQDQIPNGVVVTLAFTVPAGAAAQVLPVDLDDASAATPLGTAFETILLNDGSIILGCTPPAAAVPSASQGRSDGVLIEWAAVSGAQEYRVYRSTVNAAGSAVPVSDWQAATTFLDTTAVPPAQGSSTGCGNSRTLTHYYYWVISRSQMGCESAFGPSAMGYRGSPPEAAKALPALSRSGLGEAAADAPLAVRLLISEAIAPESVWVTVDTAGEIAWEVQWQPGSVAGDGWVVVTPEEAWPADAVVTVTAGAETVSGTPVAPSRAQWSIHTDSEGGSLLWQPSFIDFAAIPYRVGGQKTVAARVFELDSAIGPGRVFRIAPEAPLVTPQRVWLPIPAGVSLSDVRVSYLDGGVWLDGRSVAGWLVSDTFEETTQGGQRMVGLVMRHGGTVRLATASDVRPASIGADSLLLLLAAGVLAVRARPSWGARGRR